MGLFQYQLQKSILWMWNLKLIELYLMIQLIRHQLDLFCKDSLAIQR